MFKTKVISISISNPDESIKYFYQSHGIYLQTTDPELLYFAKSADGVWSSSNVDKVIVLLIHRDNSLDSLLHSEQEVVEYKRNEINERLFSILKRRASDKFVDRNKIYQALRQAEFDQTTIRKLYGLFINLGWLEQQDYIHRDDLNDVLGVIKQNP